MTLKGTLLVAVICGTAIGTSSTQNLPVNADITGDEAKLIAQMTPVVETKPDPATPQGEGSAMATVTAVPKPTPSQNVTINLIHRLVQRGVLTQGDAAAARALAAQQQRARVAKDDETTPQLFAEPSPLPQMTARLTDASPPAQAPQSTEEGDAVSVSD